MMPARAVDHADFWESGGGKYSCACLATAAIAVHAWRIAARLMWPPGAASAMFCSFSEYCRISFFPPKYAHALTCWVRSWGETACVLATDASASPELDRT